MARKAPPITEKQLSYARALLRQIGIHVDGDLSSLTEWNGIGLINELKNTGPSTVRHTIKYLNQDFPRLTFSQE